SHSRAAPVPGNAAHYQRRRALRLSCPAAAVGSESQQVKVTRVYSDADGESRFADEDIELHDKGMIGHLSDPIPAKAVVFRRNDPGYDYDWHTAPQRQFIVLLDG